MLDLLSPLINNRESNHPAPLVTLDDWGWTKKKRMIKKMKKRTIKQGCFAACKPQKKRFAMPIGIFIITSKIN